jgi:hypothetical protein
VGLRQGDGGDGEGLGEWRWWQKHMSIRGMEAILHRVLHYVNEDAGESD